MKKLILSNVLTLIVGILIGGTLITRLQGQGQEQRMATPGVTQTILLNAPLAEFPGKRAVMFIGNFEPGASTPKHRHHGTEFLFVLEGEGVIEQPGGSSHELKPGVAVFHEPPPGTNGFIHQAKNLSKTDSMKTLVLLIYDSELGPAIPVK